MAFFKKRTVSELGEKKKDMPEGLWVKCPSCGESLYEQTLAKSAEGAANLREYHQQLFRNSVASLRQDIERITGRKVREAAAEVDPGNGSVTHMFTTGTTVQVFLMDGNVPSQSIPGDSHLPA